MGMAPVEHFLAFGQRTQQQLVKQTHGEIRAGEMMILTGPTGFHQLDLRIITHHGLEGISKAFCIVPDVLHNRSRHRSVCSL